MSDIYEALKVNYGSCSITLNEKGKKQPHFPSATWKDFKKSDDKKYNSTYAVCGRESNIIVVDLDDMTNPTCIEIHKISNSNLKVKTKKGFHHYFKYDDEFNHNRRFNKQEIDIKSNDGFVFGINSFYDGKIQYELIQRPENDVINPMCDELKNLIRSFDKVDKKISKKINNEIQKTNKSKINSVQIEDDIMTELLNSLNSDRSDNFENWIMCGLALYNDGYDAKYYKLFSMRSDKYEEGIELTKYNQFKDDKTNKITTATLWYWLYQDNENKFKELRDKVDFNKHDFVIDITEDYFSENKMFDLLQSDINEFGIEYRNRFFNKSKSFQYFNKFHFIMTENDAIFKIEFVGKRKEIKKIVINGYKCFTYTFKIKYDFIDDWMKSIHSQRYATIQFSPKEKINNEAFNLFNGFVYEDDNKEYNLNEIMPILDHIKYLCKDEKEVYEYILNWISHIIQKPNRKTESAVVFYSQAEGVGKNALTDILTKIFDGYVAPVTLNDLTGKFNSLLKAKLLLIGDEITPKAKELNNELKNAITRKDYKLEYKGLEPITMKDRANYIFTTNNELAFRVSDQDRRYCLIECPSVKKNETYFDKLYKLIDDENIMKQFFNFLLVRDISNINIRKIPLTKYKQRNQEHNMPHYIQMIIDNPRYYCNKDWTVETLKTELANYEKDKKIYHKDTTNRTLIRDLTKYFGCYRYRTNKIKCQLRFPILDVFEQHINNVILKGNLNDDSDDEFENEV